MQQLEDAQSSPEIIVNENFATLEHQAVYGENPATTTALTWGYYGGRWGGFEVDADTVALTAASTNYLVVAAVDGALSVSVLSTNWDDSANYSRVYKITTGASTVLTVEDHRAGPGGVHGGAGGGSGSVTSWKQAVRAASTANGTLATAFENGDTVDGVTLATGDRILLKNQSSATENGIYIVAASGAPARSADADLGTELVNAVVAVSEGTANADTSWICTTNGPITLGATSLTFSAFVGAGVWGSITGTLSAQTDLQAALDAKANDRRTVTALTSTAGVCNVDVSLGDYFTFALTEAVTSITFSNLPGAGKGATLMIRITQDSTPRAVTWPASFKWESGTSIPVSTGSGVIDLLAISTLSNGTAWDATLSRARG